MKRILVTGGCGFIGTNLVNKLLEEYLVDVVDTNPGYNFRCSKLYPISVLDDQIHTLEHDYYAVVHLAAMSRIQPSIKEPILTHNINVNGTLNMLEFSRLRKCKFIFVSTSSAYHTHFANPYTFTKVMGEQYALLFHKMYELNITIARLFNVYGPGQIETGPYANVMGVFEYQFRNKLPLTITGGGEQRRDFCHVTDVCEALKLMVDDDTFSPDLYDIGTGVNYSINELADLFGGERKYMKGLSGEANSTLCDNYNAQTRLNWVPKITVYDYVRNITHGIKKN